MGDLRNKVVIGDALHTQRQVSIQIGTAGGHYLWTVKANQPQLMQGLQDWFDLEVKLLPGMGCPPRDFCSAALVNKLIGQTGVLALIAKANYPLIPSARRFFAAHPDQALSLLF